MGRSVAAAAAEADDGRKGGAETELFSRGNRDVKLLLVEIGVAVAVSFASFLFRPRSRPPPTRRTSSRDGGESKTGGKDTARDLEEQLCVARSEETLGKTINAASTIMSAEEEESLFPELEDPLMEEPEATGTDLVIAKLDKETAMEQEIVELRELVSSLRERERTLELQLLGYHGAKEQDASVRELESRLKISAMETKLYMLKMESLKAENQKLQAQLVDHSRAMSELEAAKAQIELLSKKLKSDGEKAKEIMASLQQNIASLQYREEMGAERDAELEMKLKRMEHEVEELTRANSRLAEEKSDLAEKLQSAQVTLPPVLEGSQVEELEEANKHMRRTNEQLMQEVEQLRTDRCADVEELVYLRWVNACLRYELRNYQPPQGRAAARELSKCLSPKSEARAKQLILEYANTGADDKTSNLFEVDSEYSSSSSQASAAGEHEDSDKKAKFLSKLKKLVLGKGKQKNKVSALDGTPSSGDSERRASFSVCSIDDAIGRGSYDSSPSCILQDSVATDRLAGTEAQAIRSRHSKDQSHSRLSLDIQRLPRLDLEEASHEEILLLKEILINYGPNGLTDREDSYFPENSDIKKFADALRSARDISKIHGRSASFR